MKRTWRTADDSRDVDPGPATVAWQLMNDLVAAHDPTQTLRETLVLGRGTGRVRALLSLSDGPLGLADLANAIGVDAPYATIITNELEARGLISRARNDHDRRRRHVGLTPDGRAAVATARQIIDRPPPELQQLSTADLDTLVDLLHRVRSVGAQTRVSHPTTDETPDPEPTQHRNRRPSAR